MKKGIVLLLITLFLVGGAVTAYASAEAPRGYNQVAATNELELFFNDRTAGVAVLDVASGQFWFSNPVNINDDDIARGVNRSRLLSQIEITFATPRGSFDRYNSYDYSVSNGTFTYELIQNGIRVIYEFSDVRRDITFLPQFISEERLRERILDQIPDRTERDRIRNLFIFDHEVDAFRRTDDAQSELAMARIFETLERIGYDDEEMQYDRDMFTVDAGDERRPRFGNVAVSYEIIGDMFYATLHTGDIEEPDGFAITEITFLEFFGAADWYSQGYMFVPDGSGALIYLNNGRSFAQSYRAPVYGRDRAFVLQEDILQSETIRLPVFGMNKNDHGFLAIIQAGDAMAHINADVSGRTNSFNSVFASFTIRSHDIMVLADGDGHSRSATLFQADRFEGDVRIAYHFLHGEQSGFVGMANFYRSYLAEKYSLTPVTNANIPFYLEFIGGFERRTSFLGIPITRFTPMTTFSQAQDITEAFLDSGVTNMNVVMNGWFNSGVRHSSPTNINVPRRLGGTNGLTSLNDFLEEQDVGFYPVVNMMTNQRPGFFENTRQTSSRQINQRPANEFHTYIPTYLYDSVHRRSWIISPRTILSNLRDFLRRFTSFNIGGVAFLDMGQHVQSDFYSSDMYTRQDCMDIIIQGLGEMGEEHSIIVSGGNAPTIAYASHILNVPFSHSAFRITDRSVPFMQFALRGYVDFAGEAINMWDVRSLETAFLKILEFNSGVYFTISYERSDITKRTEFEYLLSTYHVTWFDAAVDIYTRANYQLRDVRHAAIISHELVYDGVVRVGYDNGVVFTINYNFEPVLVDGVEIPALSFIREDG